MYEVDLNYVKRRPEDGQRQERLVKLLGTALERYLRDQSALEQSDHGLDVRQTISVTTHCGKPSPPEES